MSSSSVIKMGTGRARTLGSTLLRDVIFEDRPVSRIRLHVVQDLNHDIIVGMDVLQRENVIIDARHRRLLFAPDASPSEGFSIMDDINASESEPAAVCCGGQLTLPVPGHCPR